MAFLAVGCGKILGIEEVEHADSAVATDSVSETEAASDVSDTIETAPFDTGDECVPGPDSGPKSGPYRDLVAFDHPVAYWTFDEPINAISVADRVAGFSGAVAGTGTITFREPGVFAREGNFSAKVVGASYFEMGKILEFGTRAYSIEVWFKPTRLDPDVFRKPVAKEIGILTTSRSGYNVHFTDTVTRSERWYGGKAGPNVNGPQPDLDQWNHVVARYDPVRKQSSLYFGGIEAIPVTTIADVSTSGTFRVAQDLDGWIDEVAIYDYVLPCHRIRAHYAVATAK